MKKSNEKSASNKTAILWIASLILLLGTLFARAGFPQYPWLTACFATALLVVLGFIAYENRQAFKTRSAAFGAQSAATTVLVIAIIGVINFLAARYPAKLDLTKNKLHTLSDQTQSVMKGLEKPVKAVYFSKLSQRDEVRPFLENLRSLNPGKFEIEWIDPDREPMRTKQAGIRAMNTLQIVAGERDTKLTEVNEEKVTNALIKLLRDKSFTLCTMTGHGEKDFNSSEAEGYKAISMLLTEQAYQVKDLNLIQEQKIPDDCAGIAIIGPQRSFFEPELKIIRDYLANGGRAIFALDINLQGTDLKQLDPILAEWHVKPLDAVIIDPYMRRLNQDAAVPVLGAFSKDNPITQKFGGVLNAVFPLSRPLEMLPDAPAGMNVQWLAQSTSTSFAEFGIKDLKSGRLEMNNGVDKPGPLTAAVAVSGKLKDSKASQNTRLVVFGNSLFAANQWVSYGVNLDFFLNAVHWVLEDESMISIRAKEEGPGRLEMTENTGRVMWLLTVLVIPLLVSVSGIGIWAYRRKM